MIYDLNHCTKGDKKNSNGDCSTNALWTIMMVFNSLFDVENQWSNMVKAMMEKLAKMDGFS
jgi:glyceraldehyde-3-phosphate dehydrogenase/erythrose-4-phosphate dehydrogenase